MHFVEANTAEIKQKWDALVEKNQASVFSQSSYLDATAESWMILYNEMETAGIACPYTRKAGVLVLVTPFYFRYVEWIGEPIDQQLLIQTLKRQFAVCSLQIKGQFGSESKYYQVLEPKELMLNQQAKRSLKKAANMHVTSQLDVEPLFQLIQNELVPKVAGIDSKTVPLLRQLIHKYDQSIVQLNLLDDSTWVGGIWLLETDSVMYYVKGTTTQQAKKSGGMYKLILSGIELAASKRKLFDFGGSNAPSVRQFNRNFGGEDVFYSEISWNQAPFWWNALRFFKNLLKR